jgi:hypothetical protein
LYEFEGFVVLERLPLSIDEIEQQKNIDAEERLEQAEEEEQNERERLQFEYSVHIIFFFFR